MEKERNLIWIDLEFSGLDFRNDKILEIATIITDSELNILATGPNIAIKTPKKILNNMDEWNSEHHKESGLIKRCEESGFSMRIAERETLKFLKNWTLEQTSPICGNSVGQDRKMLFKDMPDLEKYFNYRTIDVSTIKELDKRWRPRAKKFQKEGTHTALRDIEESIAELKFYKKRIWRK